MGEELLAELGYEVICRTSSKDALALLQEDLSRFDLVITDQTMPEMTGVELARRCSPSARICPSSCARASAIWSMKSLQGCRHQGLCHEAPHKKGDREDDQGECLTSNLLLRLSIGNR